MSKRKRVRSRCARRLRTGTESVIVTLSMVSKTARVSGVWDSRTFVDQKFSLARQNYVVGGKRLCYYSVCSW